MVKKGVEMQVNFNPVVSFKHQTPTSTNNSTTSVAQVVVVPENQKKSGFREDISRIAKFFTTLSEMTKATVKAAAYGGLTAGAFLAGFWTFGALPRGFKKGNSLMEVCKRPIKNISTKGKIITTLATLGVASYHLIKGKLVTNQRTANVDHQLKTGHRTA